MMTGNHEVPIDLVAPQDACLRRRRDRQACPHCGERDCDELVWLDDERVECQRCKTVYRPGGVRDARDHSAS